MIFSRGHIWSELRIHDNQKLNIVRLQQLYISHTGSKIICSRMSTLQLLVRTLFHQTWDFTDNQTPLSDSAIWPDFSQTFTSGQRILERQRYQFPNNWIYTDQVEGEWDAFCAILKKKDSHIQQQVRCGTGLLFPCKLYISADLLVNKGRASISANRLCNQVWMHQVLFLFNVIMTTRRLPWSSPQTGPQSRDVPNLRPLPSSNTSYHVQVSQLQERIMSEDKSLAGRTQDLVSEWNINKPIQGNIKPSNALDVSYFFLLKWISKNLDVSYFFLFSFFYLKWISRDLEVWPGLKTAESIYRRSEPYEAFMFQNFRLVFQTYTYTVFMVTLK